MIWYMPVRSKMRKALSAVNDGIVAFLYIARLRRFENLKSD